MKSKLLTLILVLGLLLSACGQGATEETTEPAAGGGTVTLIIPEEPTTLNYYMSDAAITRQVADATSMTGLDVVDENGEFVPVLAAELPTEANGGLSADKLTVTWMLRSDLKWSDGEPITSDDIKFTWEVLSDPGSGALAGTGGIDQIASIETPDDHTVVVTLSAPNAAMLAQ